MSVTFHHLPKKIFRGKTNQLKVWLNQIAISEKKVIGKINYIFCGDEDLIKINKEYLSHDTFTDIITFDYGSANEISGEIYISTDRVAENATSFKVSESEEMIRVMAHGILHLCGYKDKKIKERNIMSLREDWCLKEWKKSSAKITKLKP